MMGDGEAYAMEEVSIGNAFKCKYHETQFTVAETNRSLFFSCDKQFKGRQYWVGDTSKTQLFISFCSVILSALAFVFMVVIRVVQFRMSSLHSRQGEMTEDHGS